MTHRPIRIALLSASLELGGSERQMVNLAIRLPRDRFAVEFVLLVDHGPLAEVAAQADIPIHMLGWHRGDVPFGRLRRVGNVVRYVRLVRRRRYDIVDAWLFHAYVLGAFTRDIAGHPVLIAGRRSSSDFKSRFNLINRAFDRVAKRRADAIVANGEAVRADIAWREGLPCARIDVIRNGITPAVPMPADERARLRSMWGADSDSVVVGCVANYKAGKGLETLIEVTARLAADEPKIVTVLVGDGPRRAGLEAEIARRGLADRIILHGRAVDARALYGAFDIAVQVSVSEGLPNAVLEASAAGLPVVATDVGATREIVVHDESGRLVPPDDVDALTAQLAELARDSCLRHAMGDAGRQRVEKVFGIDRFVDETAALYERVWAEHGVRR